MSNSDQITMPAGIPVVLPEATAASGSAPPDCDRRFLISNVDWKTYRQISDALTDRHFRMSYDGKDLELMTISDDHALCSHLFAQFVVILTDETKQPRRTSGDMTLKQDELQRAVEGDQSFYITNAPRVRGRRINLAAGDPPPDLAIEIDLTTDARRRMGIYAAIRVPEIWRFDGKQTTFHQLQPDGSYLVVERSAYFPFLTGADLTRFVQQRYQLDEPELLQAFRDWVQAEAAKPR